MDNASLPASMPCGPRKARTWHSQSEAIWAPRKCDRGSQLCYAGGQACIISFFDVFHYCIALLCCVNCTVALHCVIVYSCPSFQLYEIFVKKRCLLFRVPSKRAWHLRRKLASWLNFAGLA